MPNTLAHRRYMFNNMYPPHTLRRIYELYMQGYTMQQISQKMYIDPEVVEMLIYKYEDQYKYGKNSVSTV